MMVLSNDPKNYHSKDYRSLCELTREGLYVNVVNKEGVDRCAQRFLSSCDVYPSEQGTSIREFFGTF